MAAFNEKKEADLSGKKNPTNRGGARKGGNASGERKGKGKDKVNGNGTVADVKSENGVAAEAENGEKEGTPEA